VYKIWEFKQLNQTFNVFELAKLCS